MPRVLERQSVLQSKRPSTTRLASAAAHMELLPEATGRVLFVGLDKKNVQNQALDLELAIPLPEGR